jgi:hypothetical protein
MGYLPDSHPRQLQAAASSFSFSAGKEMDMPIKTARAKAGTKRVFKKNKAGDQALNRLGQKAFQNPSPPLRPGVRALRSPVKRMAARKTHAGLRVNKSGRKTKVVV